MENKVRYNVVFIALASAISGLLFGYDAGIISGAMLFIKRSFHIDPEQVGWIVSAVPLGAMLLACLNGKISDFVGRKKVLLATALFFIIGSLICAMASSPGILICGRLLLGFAVGMSSSLSPIYIAEIAEKNRRGKLVTLYLISVNFGLFLAYIINLILAPSQAWQLMLGLGVLPGLLLLIFGSILPESPRWLMLKGRQQQAMSILKQTHGQTQAKIEFNEITDVLNKQKIKTHARFNIAACKLYLLGAIIGIFTQAVGINAIIYYAPTIFQQTGFNSATASILATVGIGLTVTVAAVIAAFFVDKLGRRNMLLSGLVGIIASLMVIVYAFSYIHSPTQQGIVALIGCIAFVACQGLSVGPACFLLPAEIYPINIRGIGMGVSITFNWLTNFLVALFFPILLQAKGSAFVFNTFIVLSVIGFILFYYFIPETKKTSLEQIELNIMAGKALRHLGE